MPIAATPVSGRAQAMWRDVHGNQDREYGRELVISIHRKVGLVYRQKNGDVNNQRIESRAIQFFKLRHQPERVSVRFLCEPWANAQRLIYPT